MLSWSQLYIFNVAAVSYMSGSVFLILPGFVAFLRHDSDLPSWNDSALFHTQTILQKVSLGTVSWLRQRSKWIPINMYVQSLSSAQLCDPMDSRLSGSSVHGIFWARILEWVAIFSSRGSSQPRDWNYVPCVSFKPLPASHLLISCCPSKSLGAQKQTEMALQSYIAKTHGYKE